MIHPHDNTIFFILYVIQSTMTVSNSFIRITNKNHSPWSQITFKYLYFSAFTINDIYLVLCI